MAQAWWLGRRDYGDTYALQQALFAARRAGTAPDTFLFLEHNPVITLGRGAKAEHLLSSEERLSALGIELKKTDRGGDITLHAPGQLVAYPIVELSAGQKDVRRYVRHLIAAMRDVTLHFGVDGGLLEDRVGLWVDRHSVGTWPADGMPREAAKIGAIGVRISRWVTLHGFALNLTTNLDLYRHIVPCGISDLGVTSIEELVGQKPEVHRAASLALTSLTTRLGLRTSPLSDKSACDLLELTATLS